MSRHPPPDRPHAARRFLLHRIFPKKQYREVRVRLAASKRGQLRLDSVPRTSVFCKRSVTHETSVTESLASPRNGAQLGSRTATA